MGVNRRNLLRNFLLSGLVASTLALPAGHAVADDVEIEFLYSPYTDYAPFMIAKDFGFFEEFGANVTLTPKGDTAETIQMLATGMIEAGGATWGAGLFNSINAGASVAIVGTLARMPDTVPSPSPFMISQKAWDEGIRTVADLKGKRVGIPGPGGFGMYSVAKALEKGGLTIDDVEAVFLPPPATAAAFANGAIDAGWSIEPFAHQLEVQKLGKPLVEDHTFGTELGFIAFNKEFVEKHEDAVVAFMAGFLKAARLLDNGGWKDDKVLDVVASYTGTDKALLTDLVQTVRSEDGSINLDSVREQEAFFRSIDKLEYEGSMDIESQYRRDLLDKANALLATKP